MSDTNALDIQINNTDSSVISALNMLAYYDIVNLDSVQNKVMKIQQILKNHPYAITAPNEELVKKLIESYTGIAEAKKLTMTKLYEEWLEYKKSITNSPNTIQRHKQHFNKYFADTAMFKRQEILLY